MQRGGGSRMLCAAFEGGTRMGLRRFAMAVLTATAASLVGSPASAEDVPTLEKARRSGEITVAYRETSMPFSYLDGNAKPTGFAYELCRAIAADIALAAGRPDLKVRELAVTSTNRIPLVQNGSVDLECGSTTNNSERQRQVAFSINYFYTGTRLLVRADSPVRGFDDLRGKSVVSVAGSTNYKLVRRVSEERRLDIDLLGAKDPAESALMVAQGRAEAFAMDDVILYFLRASALNPGDWSVVGEAVQVEPYAVMMRRDDPALKSLVDTTLARMMGNGEFEALYRRWFLAPIPPKGINLQYPMSRELRENLRALSDKPAS
jgi:ABC-type amino acid transport substrate-binding protein